jgi:hypothetical protein
LNINTATGLGNTAIGQSALKFLTSGDNNTAVGVNAMLNTTTAIQNTALGQGALQNTNGNFNTATGFQAAISDTTGINNVANGFQALFLNTTANNNTAVGSQALMSSSIVSNNTAVGWQALQFSDPAMGDDPSTAVGSFALQNNTTGTDNDAFGFQALRTNTDGSVNAAHGAFALLSNNHGSGNAAFGFDALAGNVDGNGNTAAGFLAGAAITGSFNIDIGALVFGTAADSHTTRIGIATGTDKQTACFIGGIAGVSQGTPAAVFINTTTGQLGTQPPASSVRFKHDIKPMDKTSDAILGLKPVTFHYKSDGANTPQFGLIAEEVAKVNPDLVIRDEKGEIYSVRYEAVNAMLLNEFLKEHRKVEALQASFAQQQKDFQANAARQQKQIEALTTGLQKVSAQFEASKPAPQVVNNP